MHYHLISVPDTGSDRIIVLDAGDVLQSALAAKVNLVLCGHKHRPWIWNLGPLTIAYAGTTSSGRMRGFFENTYNIITIDKGKVNVDLKVVNGERINLYDLVNRYEITQQIVWTFIIILKLKFLLIIVYSASRDTDKEPGFRYYR